MLLTFQAPDLMSLFRYSGCSKLYQSRSEAYFVTISQHDTFLRWGVVSSSPNPQAGGPPLVGCLRPLIRYIRTYPPYWRPFLHPQPEDAPCRGDSDPLITDPCLLCCGKQSMNALTRGQYQPQCWPGSCTCEELTPVPGIKPRFPGRTNRRLVTVLTDLF